MHDQPLPIIDSYERLEEFLREELGFCGCANQPEAAIEILRDVLQQALACQRASAMPNNYKRYCETYDAIQARLSFDQVPGLATWFLYFLDHHGLVVHAFNITECSITRRGEELLDVIERFYPRAIEPADPWDGVSRDLHGKHQFVRVRKEPPLFATKSELPRSINVTWPYAPSDQGSPSHDEIARMFQLEEILTLAIEGPELGFLAFINTFDGIHEWQWYVRNDDVVMKAMTEALSQHAPAPVKFSFREDSRWERYMHFRDMTVS